MMDDKRLGPHYIVDGWVVGHEQVDEPWRTYRSYVLETVRPETLIERF